MKNIAGRVALLHGCVGALVVLFAAGCTREGYHGDMPSRGLCLLAVLLLVGSGSCYLGGGLGGVIPVNAASPSNVGGLALMEAGFQYDYKRQVRVMVIGTGQLGGGAGFTSGGRSVIAPFGNGLGMDVTLHRWSDDFLLRVAGRAWPFSQEIALGPPEEAIPQPGSRVRTVFLGANFHAIGDEADHGPVGISLMAGLLGQRLTATGLEVNYTVSPVVMVGMDWSWQLLHCWFVNQDCAGHVLRAKN